MPQEQASSVESSTLTLDTTPPPPSGARAFRTFTLLFVVVIASWYAMQVLQHARESRILDVATPRRVVVKSTRKVYIPCSTGKCPVMRIQAELIDGKGRAHISDDVTTPNLPLTKLSKSTRPEVVHYLAGNESIPYGDLTSVMVPGQVLTLPIVKNAMGTPEVVSVYFPDRPFPVVMLLFAAWFLALWLVLATFGRFGFDTHFPPLFARNEKT